jgi:uncharacterized protein YecT (DUF1311 family)
MRQLQTSIAITASAVLMAACVGAGPEAGASRARDSTLLRDLELAADSGAARDVARRVGVHESGPAGTRDIAAESDAADGAVRASATSASSDDAPPAEAYIGPSCASPTRDDQQRCLKDYLAKSDALLDRYYQALILRLKSEAGTTSRSTEPPSVRRLRTAQRAWLVYRDDACRKRTRPREGPLWAPVRAQCLAEYSAVRAEELRDALTRRKALAPRDVAAKSGGSDARAPSRPTPR